MFPFLFFHLAGQNVIAKLLPQSPKKWTRHRAPLSRRFEAKLRYHLIPVFVRNQKRAFSAIQGTYTCTS
jgi:hypothetical protein